MTRVCTSHRAKSIAHHPMANERGHVAFGGSPGIGFAFSKYNDEVTLNLAEMQKQMTRNGDYTLVHAYQPAAPSSRVMNYQSLIGLFEKDPGLHRQYLARADGANLALAALFQHDRASLKTLLDDLV